MIYPEYKSFDGLEKFGIRTRIDSSLPDYLKEHALKDMREKAALQLYDIISRYPNPCVVWVEETVTYSPQAHLSLYDDFHPFDLIEIKMKTNTVRHMDVVIQDIRPVSYEPKRKSSLDRLKEFFNRMEFFR